MENSTKPDPYILCVLLPFPPPAYDVIKGEGGEPGFAPRFPSFCPPVGKLVNVSLFWQQPRRKVQTFSFTVCTGIRKHHVGEVVVTVPTVYPLITGIQKNLVEKFWLSNPN